MSTQTRPATVHELEILHRDVRVKRAMFLASIGIGMFLILPVLFIPLDGEGMPPGSSAFRVIPNLLSLPLTLVPIVTLTVYLVAASDLRNAQTSGVRD